MKKTKEEQTPLPLEEVPTLGPAVQVIRRASEKRCRERLSKPLEIFGLDHAAEALAVSAFMRPWIIEQIKTAFEKGEEFTLREGEEVQFSYKLATKDDVIEAATQGVTQTRVGDAPSRRRRSASAEVLYRLVLPPAGKKRDAALEKLKPGPRSALEVIIAAGREELNTSALQAVLEADRDKIAAKGSTPMLVRFREWLEYKDKPLAPFFEKIQPAAANGDDDEDQSEPEEREED